MGGRTALAALGQPGAQQPHFVIVLLRTETPTRLAISPIEKTGASLFSINASLDKNITYRYKKGESGTNSQRNFWLIDF